AEEEPVSEPEPEPIPTRIPALSPAPIFSIHWSSGVLIALLAPLFTVIIGNLDGAAQVLRNVIRESTSTFNSSIPFVQTIVRSVDGFNQTIGNGQPLPPYDFWGPSRVIPYTINEFPYWSFLFADLHPHMIGIPFAALFLGLLFTLLTDNLKDRLRNILLWFAFSLMLGTLANINLWELPTYFGLGVLALIVSQYRHHEQINWFMTLVASILYMAGAYILYYPFFDRFVNIGASGIGLVKEPDELGTWLLIWGFFVFILISWLFITASRPAGVRYDGEKAIKPTGIERWTSLVFRHFERLPRLVYLQSILVQRPSLGYMLGVILPAALFIATIAILYWGRTIMAICLLMAGFSFLLLWRRGRDADAGNQLALILSVCGFAVLAGTQAIYLKDFLGGGDWYRMNTLFKFFSQVWVIWAVAIAIALPRCFAGLRITKAPRTVQNRMARFNRILSQGTRAVAWTLVFLALLIASFSYLFFGTAARVDQRMVGWRPEIGTLNGLDYMLEGSYTWPDNGHTIELKYDREAIDWLLDNVPGNHVIVESSQVDYYRAGGTRVASFTGLSGLRGMHEGEQRYGEQLGPRDGLHREFWETPDIGRTVQLIDELDIALVYVSQLERHQHPDGVNKLTAMADQGLLEILFSNEGVVIYGIAENLPDELLSEISSQQDGQS
ncbi:MAG: DUF2298 domain-containing protein, partial [Chloroflexota bacterium]